jgi:tetratricopeptide (TPR) repeat protein
MAGKVFINYRRDESMDVAGRLRDRLAQAFGWKNLVVGVDRISGGGDLEEDQSNQVAACQAFVTVIGPDWLDAKDESGQRLLRHPQDSVAIEIVAALTRSIRVIPVLVDGARLPNESELPVPLKALARCQAIQLRQVHFEHGAEALVESVREALDRAVGLRSSRRTAAERPSNESELPEPSKSPAPRQATQLPQVRFDQDAEAPVESVREALDRPSGRRSWRRMAVAVAVAAGLLLFGLIGLQFSAWPPYNISLWQPGAKMPESGSAKSQAEAEAKRKSAEAEQRRLESIKAEQERQASAAAQAEAKRKSEEAEQQLAALRAQEERNRAEAEALARYASLVRQADTDYKAGNYDAAIVNYNEAIRLDPKSAVFVGRGNAHKNKGDHDRAIADFNEAIRLDSKSAQVFISRGNAHKDKGDHDRAIADFNEAVRLDPKSAQVFISRGNAHKDKGDHDRAIADFNEAVRLDPKSALALRDRGDAYAHKGENDRAIADLNEALRLDSKDALALSNRGVAYGKKADYERALADFNQAIRVDPKSAHAFRNRGVIYAHKGNNDQAIADFNEAIRLDPKNALALCDRGNLKRNINDASGSADIERARRLEPSSCR